jgi:hypothetical protein
MSVLRFFLPARFGFFDCSHALRGTTFVDALRPRFPETRSVHRCVTTRSEGTIIEAPSHRWALCLIVPTLCVVTPLRALCVQGSL